ncbi:MAG TPA: ferritin-like domain-containing protein [Hellea balneolensis]|uniref:Ferritin-like domain-containing protein n=1 Tax=Hellea balneolensis TaxID=287478 RepID=A0A7C5R4H9_9PROT|nr:ferritin-like domain-containing protein [Hellea balneolensis]
MDPAPDQNTVQAAAIRVLNTGNPADKAERAVALSKGWRAGNFQIGPTPNLDIPDQPARPAQPQLVAPREVKRRRLGSPKGRIALLHAIAHIELNAIDLAADMVARFAADARISNSRRHEFVSDWTGVCADEARHFTLIEQRLADLEARYGDLSAHNGLWEAAIKTRSDLAARLVVAPMVLEARGLDVTPPMIAKLERLGDQKSADILKIIYEEEIPHVRAGARWFEHICTRENRDGRDYFSSLLSTYFNGNLKPPFNEKARTQAQIPPSYYQTV